MAFSNFRAAQRETNLAVPSRRGGAQLFPTTPARRRSPILDPRRRAGSNFQGRLAPSRRRFRFRLRKRGNPGGSRFGSAY